MLDSIGRQRAVARQRIGLVRRLLQRGLRGLVVEQAIAEFARGGGHRQLRAPGGDPAAAGGLETRFEPRADRGPHGERLQFLRARPGKLHRPPDLPGDLRHLDRVTPL